jgi:hypothetical protein
MCLQMAKKLRRNFGVEIECYPGMGQDKVERMLRISKAGNGWDVGSDGSLDYNGVEIRTPVFKFERKNLDKIRRFCKLFHSMGAYATQGCGLHVHIEAKDLDDNQLSKIFDRYKKFEKEIDSFIDKDRRKNNNDYCQSLTSDEYKHNYSYADYIEDMETPFYYTEAPKTKKGKFLSKKEFIVWSKMQYFRDTKDLKVNAFHLKDGGYGTIEFRHHHGTVQGADIANWVSFLHHFVEASLSKNIPKKDRLWRNIPINVKKHLLSRKRLFKTIENRR